MTKGNAREILSHTLDRFKEATNEAVGLVFTWNGGLTVLGCNAFKVFVSVNKIKCGKLLASQNQWTILSRS